MGTPTIHSPIKDGRADEPVFLKAMLGGVRQNPPPLGFPQGGLEVSTKGNTFPPQKRVRKLKELFTPPSLGKLGWRELPPRLPLGGKTTFQGPRAGASLGPLGCYAPHLLTS